MKSKAPQSHALVTAGRGCHAPLWVPHRPQPLLQGKELGVTSAKALRCPLRCHSSHCQSRPEPTTAPFRENPFEECQSPVHYMHFHIGWRPTHIPDTPDPAKLHVTKPRTTTKPPCLHNTADSRTSSRRRSDFLTGRSLWHMPTSLYDTGVSTGQ